MPPTPDEIEAELMRLFETAHAMDLDLADDDTGIDLAYVGQKLTKVSRIIEILSKVSMDLTKLSLAIKKRQAETKRLLELTEKEIKASPEYSEQSRNSKGHWVQQKLGEQRVESDRWTHLTHVVSEVKEAVANRAQDMKRLDSDLRLHQKILELKIAQGGGSGMNPRKFPGGESQDITLDLTKD